MNDILERVSNFVVECSDGRRIKCDKYTMLRFSGVFRRMYDDLGELEDGVEVTLPMHSSIVVDALKMAHGIVRVSDLASLEDCDACMRGIQYLELEADTDAILERMLGMCTSQRPGLSILTGYAHWFFESFFFASRFLSVLMKEESSFRSVSRALQGIHIRMDVLKAMFSIFLTMYPAQPVVALFVNAMNPAMRTAENVLSLLNHRMSGFNIHPLELNRITKHLLAMDDMLDPVTRHFVEFTQQATTAGHLSFDGGAATCVTLDNDTCLSIVVHGDFDDTVVVKVGDCLLLTLAENLDIVLCESVLGRSCHHTVRISLVSMQGEVFDVVYDADHIFEKEPYAGQPYPVAWRLSDGFVQTSKGASLQELYRDRSALDYIKIIVQTGQCITHA